MSRFVQALANWTEDLDYAGMKRLLEDVRERLNARRAHIVFHFPYFVQKNAPATACPGILPYECRLTGELPEDGKPSFLLEVTVPVMTVCPCSKAISREGAHSQRADVRKMCIRDSHRTAVSGRAARSMRGARSLQTGQGYSGRGAFPKRRIRPRPGSSRRSGAGSRMAKTCSTPVSSSAASRPDEMCIRDR